MPTIRNLAINVSASSDTTLIAAVPDRKIKVTAYTLQSTGTVIVKFKNGATDLTGPLTFQAREGISSSGTVDGPLFVTDANTAFVINLSAAVAVVGHLTYYTDDKY